jgi:hypothetical protein
MPRVSMENVIRVAALLRLSRATATSPLMVECSALAHTS